MLKFLKYNSSMYFRTSVLVSTFVIYVCEGTLGHHHCSGGLVIYGRDAQPMACGPVLPA